MISLKDKSLCNGCFGCCNICPMDCIEMKCDDEGFFYPDINKDICIKCGKCIQMCPSLKKKELSRSPVAYEAINTSDIQRRESSSGGIFSLFAEFVLENNGFVYGAAFDDEFNVIHKKISCKENLKQLRGSKYLQSKINFIYKDVRSNLESGRLVYFSGTPCQIGGLLSYLNKEYDNLLCQDIVCHGVPSAKVWRKYLNEINKTNDEKLKKVNFRNKNHGWKNYSLSIEYEHENYVMDHNHDLFMQVFVRNINLRPSCYNCKFKTLNRQSDITLGDLWGIDHIDKTFNDDKGVSLVLINSEKGKRLFDFIKEKTTYRHVDLYETIRYNESAIKSAKQPIVRDVFFKHIDSWNIRFNMKYCCILLNLIKIKEKLFGK